MSTFTPESAWVAAAVAEVLLARHERRVPRSVPRDHAIVVDAVPAAASAHRVVPLVAPHAHALGLPPAVMARLHRSHRRAIVTGLAVAADTALVDEVLTAAGIEHLVVKGATLDALLGHAPGTRGPSDIDVWVPPDAVAAAGRALTGEGWLRRAAMADYPRPEDGWPWRLLVWGGKELPYERPDRSSIDLHWRLTNGRRHLSFDFADALGAATTVTIGGRAVPTLDPAHALEHLAAHGRKEAWPYLRQVVDVVETAERVGAERLTRLATAHPEIASAIGVARFAAPWLDDVVDLGPGERRRGAEAWRGCLGLTHGYHLRMGLEGVAAWRSRFRHEWWTFRSAPSWRVRFGLDTRVALRIAIHVGRWHHRRHDRGR